MYCPKQSLSFENTPMNEGRVLFPPGTTVLHGPLIVGSDVHIEGYGTKVTNIKPCFWHGVEGELVEFVGEGSSISHLTIQARCPWWLTLRGWHWHIHAWLRRPFVVLFHTPESQDDNPHDHDP